MKTRGRRQPPNVLRDLARLRDFKDWYGITHDEAMQCLHVPDPHARAFRFRHVRQHYCRGGSESVKPGKDYCRDQRPVACWTARVPAPRSLWPNHMRPGYRPNLGHFALIVALATPPL